MSDTPKATDTPRSRRRITRRTVGIGSALVCVLLLSLLAVPVASADGGRTIRMEDECDPETFNAAGFGEICFKQGDVTFAEFLSKLNPIDGGHDDWEFSREELEIKVGQVVRVTNKGGETHSFTEVVNFGAGIVPPLNAALPPGTPDAVPVGDPGPTFASPGQGFNISGLGVGTHKFECLIHPWMRSVIKVGNQ